MAAQGVPRASKKHKTHPIQDTKVTPLSMSDKATKRVIAPYVKIVRKGQKVGEGVEESKQFSYYLQKKPSVLLRDLSSFLSDSVDLTSLLHETADVLKTVANATGVTLYIVDSAANEIYLSQKIFVSERHKIRWKIEEGTIVAAFVANKKEYVKVDDIVRDERFPQGIGYEDGAIKSVLCVPVVTPDGDCFAVIELYRQMYLPAFQADDLKITIVVTGWMGAAIHQNQQRLALQRQQQLNDYLLDLTKCYFGDTVLMEKMITEIVKFAKATLGAERGTFFIIDKENDELVADLYDEGIDEHSGMFKKSTKVRIGKERGIAGLVAKTGVTVNIKDAYNDPRFNKEVDVKTGFITRSILCMPIMGVEGILGVVQVINKKNGICFTSTDEDLFKTFSVYCALALHYAKVTTLLEKKQHLSNVTGKMLELQMVPCCHDLEDYNAKLEVETPEGFEEFKWYISLDDFDNMPRYCYTMISKIAGPENVNPFGMMKFILMLRKLYRDNPYHNFEHAFNVCHCMFNILKRNKHHFSTIEQKALIIAALGHDVDHVGLTNNFLQLVNDDLAQLYAESILENHHYRVTMLAATNCKIYKNLTDSEFIALSKEIKDAIMATDLALYFKCRSKLTLICNELAFDWTLISHKTYLKAIMMTSCDLSGQCKPFNDAKRITDNLYREFYHQGDREKEMGLCPLSIMDREKQHTIPEDQVQFLSVVVIPCVELMRALLGNTESLYNESCALRKTWLEIIEVRGRKCWRQDDSIVHD